MNFRIEYISGGITRYTDMTKCENIMDALYKFFKEYGMTVQVHKVIAY